MRIHVTGASGSGTTTLAAELAKTLDCPHFDSDDYFWIPTEIAYTEKRPVEERGRLLMADLQKWPNWVLSGCKCNWSETHTDNLYDLVIFLYVPQHIRLERLKERETTKFGQEAIEPGGYFHDNHTAFIEWASGYDTYDESTRSKQLHENWLSSLSCPVLRLEEVRAVTENLQTALDFIKTL